MNQIVLVQGGEGHNQGEYPGGGADSCRHIAHRQDIKVILDPNLDEEERQYIEQNCVELKHFKAEDHSPTIQAPEAQGGASRCVPVQFQRGGRGPVGPGQHLELRYLADLLLNRRECEYRGQIPLLQVRYQHRLPDLPRSRCRLFRGPGTRKYHVGPQANPYHNAAAVRRAALLPVLLAALAPDGQTEHP